MRGMNNERVCKHNPTLRSSVARVHTATEKGRKGFVRKRRQGTRVGGG